MVHFGVRDPGPRDLDPGQIPLYGSLNGQMDPRRGLKPLQNGSKKGSKPLKTRHFGCLFPKFRFSGSFLEVPKSAYLACLGNWGFEGLKSVWSTFGQFFPGLNLGYPKIDHFRGPKLVLAGSTWDLAHGRNPFVRSSGSPNGVPETSKMGPFWVPKWGPKWVPPKSLLFTSFEKFLNRF